MSLLVFACMSAAVQAEVFKCTGSFGKTTYQEKPCDAAVKGRQLDIKTDPEKEAEARARLQTLQMENDARRAARREAEKEAAAQRSQAEQLDALRRSALAQQQQAVAQQRQADALEKQNQQINSPLWVLPGYSTLPRQPGARFDQHSDRQRRRDRDDDRPGGGWPRLSP